jgi:8-oxo-dGTP pyrophosphatase MutT (NUDIX family)
VKCVFDDGAGRLLFVRHTYGRRGAWELPGGGAHGDEEPAVAARREAREELGADVAAWTPLGRAEGRWHGKTERLDVFGARWPGGPVRPDPVEIAEAAWFPRDAPPSPLGPSTRVALRTLR